MGECYNPVVWSKPWKQYVQKVPDSIKHDLLSLNSDTFIVSCLKRIKKEDISKGYYSHIGIKIVSDKVEFIANHIPSTRNGKFSSYNVNGKNVVLKDEPKVSKHWYITSPNFGDWSKGSHENDFERDVYQRDFIPPKLLELVVELMAFDIQKESYVFKFTVQEVLNKQSVDLNNQLLFNINLLQENIGNFGVIKDTASYDDYLKTLYVNWEIFPPGESDETYNRILNSFGKNLIEKTKNTLKDRYGFLEKFKPKNYIRGTNGFRKYFGAQFENNLVVFENLEYGNAVYIMHEDWEKLSQLSRIDLLKSQNNGFERIVHTKTWKLRLGSLIRKS